MSYIVGSGKNWVASKDGDYDIVTGTLRGHVITVRTKENSNMAEVFIDGRRAGGMPLNDVEGFVIDRLEGRI